MNIVLAAINAKYIHSNLAVYSLRAYAGDYQKHVFIAEYTINQRLDFILQELYQKKPDILCFSCYIWNISYVIELAAEIHKLLPGLPIWLGGPEVSYESEAFIGHHPAIKGIMLGEGETTFCDLCDYYVNHGKRLEEIPGLLFRGDEGKIVKTADKKLLDINEIPFCYDESMTALPRILYYESSRGCPFHCSYCLSGIEKSLRFRKLALVEKELLFFIEHKVRQVKFVDRTFNCNHEHAMGIWRFLKEHDNGRTNFHFEISADLLTEEEIEFISTLRPGLIQLEIGIQSTNMRTIQEIRRTMDLERVETVVKSVKKAKNVHQHLDLIAGLPYEDYNSFTKSFDRIYRLQPEQLQLGFLKVLKGSFLYEHNEEYGILYHEKPPYEVLSTKWLSYDELLDIKQAEEMLEVYYNSGQFEMTIPILEHAFERPFQMYLELGRYYQNNNLSGLKHSRMRRYEILLEFAAEKDSEHIDLYKETLTFDLYLREKMKSRPRFAHDPALGKAQMKKYQAKAGRNLANEKSIHIEPFFYDFTTYKFLSRFPEKKQELEFYLFSYDDRDELTGQAKVRNCTNYFSTDPKPYHI